jgi:hypothetical protein
MNIIFESIEETQNSGEVKITFSASGEGSSINLDNLQIHISEVMPLRDNWKMSVGTGRPPDFETTNTVLATGFENGLYEITSVTTGDVMKNQREIHPISGVVGFNIPLTLTPAQAKAHIEKIKAEREALVNRVLVARDAPEGSPEFTAVIYYAGVKLHEAFVLSGAEVFPVDGSLGLEGMEAPLVANLAKLFKIEVSFPENLKMAHHAANKIFAVRLFKIRATEIGYAAGFARNYADDLASILSTERHEKPRYCATFVLGKDSYSFYTAYQDYRGNWLSPMFPNVQAEMIERYQPVINKSDYARLLITLLSEAIGERNPAFQYWRSWLILEQIAKKHITSANQALFYPDGTQIHYANGDPANTRGAKGKVYQYLMQNHWQSFDLVKKANDGRLARIEGADPNSHDPKKEMIKLWDAVGAMYSVRNKVAHTSVVNQPANPTNEEVLAVRIASDGPFTAGFLYSMAKWAVWREVEHERALIDK